MLYAFIFAAVAAQASSAVPQSGAHADIASTTHPTLNLYLASGCTGQASPFDLQETPTNWCFFSPTRFNSASIVWPAQPAGAALPFTVVVGPTTEPGCKTLKEIPVANECFDFHDGPYGDFAVLTSSG